MKIKRFQKLSKFLSNLSKLVAVLILSILIIGSFNLFIRENFATFSLGSMGSLSILFSDATVTQDDYEWAISIVLPVVLAFLGYIFFKISYLFDYLAEGQTPFSHSFSQSVKVLGILLIFSDLATSLLYVFLVNFVANGGIFFYFSLSSFFFIGLILCLTSSILDYGINLQKLADDVIHEAGDSEHRKVDTEIL